MEKALHWADAVHFRKVFSATEGLAVQAERGAEPVRGAVMVRGQRGCRVSLCPTPSEASLHPSRTLSPGTSSAPPPRLITSKCQKDCIQNSPIKNTCSWLPNLHEKGFPPSHRCTKPDPKTREILHQHSTCSEQGAPEPVLFTNPSKSSLEMRSGIAGDRSQHPVSSRACGSWSPCLAFLDYGSSLYRTIFN